MSLNWGNTLTFGLLASSVIALWIPAPQLSGSRSWLWVPSLAIATIAGYRSEVVNAQAVFSLVIFAITAFTARTVTNKWVKSPFMLATWVAPLAFAGHRIPGFSYPMLVEPVRLSVHGPLVSLHANFDMAAVGVILAGLFCDRIFKPSEWGRMFREVGPVAVAAAAVVLGFGCLVGYIQPDLKWHWFMLMFLSTNMLFTCVTEEAYFRGLTFLGLCKLLSKWRYGQIVSAALSSVLFGVAHLRGGVPLFALATMAGAFYVAAYMSTKRFEGAVFTHFLVNALHMIAFTYPNLTN